MFWRETMTLEVQKFLFLWLLCTLKEGYTRWCLQTVITKGLPFLRLLLISQWWQFRIGQEGAIQSWMFSAKIEPSFYSMWYPIWQTWNMMFFMQLLTQMMTEHTWWLFYFLPSKLVYSPSLICVTKFVLIFTVGVLYKTQGWHSN